MLAQVARGIATRTERNKITVGGNLLSDLPYREAILPFLLAESEAVIATEKGLIKRSIEKLNEMDEGEFLVQIITDSAVTKAPFTYVKRTRQSRVNYPIVTTTSVQLDSEVRVAISGLCHHPIRSRKMEEVMRDSKASRAELMDKLHKTVPAEVIDDELATRAYRSFVFEQTMEPMLAKRREA
jgi:xanthine dehydrogenase molybdenum-binding subunit